MTGYKTIKEKETEKKRGKKRFLERLCEEKEAEKTIKDFCEKKLSDDNQTEEFFDGKE